MRAPCYALVLGAAAIGCTAGEREPANQSQPPAQAVLVATSASAPPATQLIPRQDECELRLGPLSDGMRSPSPAYLVFDEALFRVDASGARRIDTPLPVPARPDQVGYFAGPAATLWVRRDDGLFAMGPNDSRLRRVAASPWPTASRLVVRSESDIWAIRRDELAHYDGTQWSTWPTIEVLGALPSQIVATEDALFALVGERIWKGSVTGWSPAVPTAIENSELRVRRLFATQRRLIGETNGGHCMRTDSWRCSFTTPDSIRGNPWLRGIIGVGPSGMVAWDGAGLSGVGDDSCFIDVEGTGDDGKPFTFSNAIFDGSDRAWVQVLNGFRVINKRGAIVAEYRAGMLDGIDGAVSHIVVPGAGPKSFPLPKKRRAIEVVGTLRLEGTYRPLRGATVTVQIGAGVARTATTDTSGGFRLGDVPEGDYEVNVTPAHNDPACPSATSDTGFRFRTARDCAASKLGSGACNLGPLAQCKQRVRHPGT